MWRKENAASGQIPVSREVLDAFLPPLEPISWISFWPEFMGEK
jgi:hypothetical protein